MLHCCSMLSYDYNMKTLLCKILQSALSKKDEKKRRTRRPSEKIGCCRLEIYQHVQELDGAHGDGENIFRPALKKGQVDSDVGTGKKENEKNRLPKSGAEDPSVGLRKMRP